MLVPVAFNAEEEMWVVQDKNAKVLGRPGKASLKLKSAEGNAMDAEDDGTRRLES